MYRPDSKRRAQDGGRDQNLEKLISKWVGQKEDAQVKGANTDMRIHDNGILGPHLVHRYEVIDLRSRDDGRWTNLAQRMMAA